MIRISQLKIKISHTDNDIKAAVLKKLRIDEGRLRSFCIVKKSIDARDKKDIHYSVTVDAEILNEDAILKNKRLPAVSKAERPEYRLPKQGKSEIPGRPVVVGMGPAGLFCAYMLALEGYRPIVFERGECVEDRTKTVNEFLEGKSPLNPKSNVQFGEGGAGTFSDGKLNTGVNDSEGRNRLVLETFVKYGGPEDILYSGKPHLGTDKLVSIVSGMRKEIIACGGEVHFNSLFESFQEKAGLLESITVNGETIPCSILVLAPGHSARDTFRYLIGSTNLDIEAKSFAVGVRIEHKQQTINDSQYGKNAPESLPPAPYKLTYHTGSGKSVYSFCMCPGGYVINSSSAPGKQCINGMSYSKRNSENANAAIVVGVTPSETPLGCIEFQESLEKAAFEAGNGKIISQRFEDFEKGRVTAEFGSIKPVHKGETVKADINKVLPKEICESLKEGIHAFGRKTEGFDDPDAVISAVESRTSSPIRIKRDSGYESAVKGIFPCGEGAGYAGGITSAAMDGIRVFEEIYRRWSGFRHPFGSSLFHS